MRSKEQKFLYALLESRTIREACKKADISVTTGNRYRKSPEFQRAYKQAKRELIESANNQLRGLTVQAVETLKNVLSSKKSSTTEKIRAAKIVLDSSFHIQEVDDIIKRLDSLEQKTGNEP